MIKVFFLIFEKYKSLFKEKNMQAKLPIYPSQPPSFFIPKNGHPIFLKLKAFQFRKKGWSRPKFVGKKILPICFVCNLVWLRILFWRGCLRLLFVLQKTDKKGILTFRIFRNIICIYKTNLSLIIQLLPYFKECIKYIILVGGVIRFIFLYCKIYSKIIKLIQNIL